MVFEAACGGDYELIFESAPIALWVEDLSGVGMILDSIRAKGVTDLTGALEADPGLLDEIIASIEVVAANPAAATLVDAPTASDLLGRISPATLSTDARNAFIAQIEAVWTGQDRIQIEFEGSTVATDPIDCSLHWAVPCIDGHRDLRRVVVAITDITTRRQEERRKEALLCELEKLNRELDRYRSLIEVTTDAILSVDAQGAIRSWNPGAASMFGYTAAEAIGMDLAVLIPGQFREQHERAFQRHRKGSPPRTIGPLEVSGVRHDGSEVPIELTVSTWESDRGPAAGAIIRDISERRARENRLIELAGELEQSHRELEESHRELGLTQARSLQAQRLESIGELAAGIAHEINTPIQYIGDNTRFGVESLARMSEFQSAVAALRAAAAAAGLDEAVKSFDDAQRELDIEFIMTEAPTALGQTIEGVNHVAEIVRALKDFAHPGPKEVAPIDLTHTIKSALSVSRNEWKYVADVTTDLDPALSDVPALKGPLSQALLNIIVNAAHAVAARVGDHPKPEDKGTIHVTTAEVGPWAEIRIADTGAGIAEEVRPRVFDPFFTTKEPGRGTGQGLAIAHNVVVRQHGGSLTFETEVGVGTTFVIRVPRRAAAEAA